MLGRRRTEETTGSAATAAPARHGSSRAGSRGGATRSSTRSAPAGQAGGAPAGPRNGTAGKGRPTPRRNVAQAANRRPLVVTDRKAAAKASRERLRDERVRMRSAMETGDDRHLPVRDKGPARRYVRDVVDARHNVGEYLIFAALALVVLTFFPNQQVRLAGTLLLWLVVLATVVDAYVLNRQLKKRLRQRFGADVPAGSIRYGILRALQIRRSRLPKPLVRHGQYPA